VLSSLRRHTRFIGSIGSETQQNASRWRALTYDSLERGSSSLPPAIVIQENAESWAQGFVSRVIDNTIRPLVHAFRPGYDLKLNAKALSSMNNLAIDAYLWSHKVNTGLFRHDFHPLFFPFNEMFNPQEMVRESGTRTKTERTVKIVASVGLGLKSSVAKGLDHDPEQALHLKVPIVTVKDI
jgi:hypothetical protein